MSNLTHQSQPDVWAERFNRMSGITGVAGQSALRDARIGIGGMGGTGGAYALMLARMGVGALSIADRDVFETANTSRQAGAFEDTMGRAKVDVMAEMVQRVNPGCEVSTFPDGVDIDAAGAFVNGCSVVVDAIDLFAMPVKRAMHAAAREHGIPSVAGACPIGWGAALTVLSPQTPTFEDVFGLPPHDQPVELDVACIVETLAPATMHQAYGGEYLTRDRNGDLKAQAVAPAIELCAALVGAEIYAILTGCRQPTFAPNVLHVDLLNRGLAVSDAYLRRNTGQWTAAAAG